MQKIYKSDRMIIGPIESIGDKVLIVSILEAYGITNLTGLPMSTPFTIRKLGNAVNWAQTHSYYTSGPVNGLYDTYVMYSSSEFIDKFRIMLEYNGYKGTHEQMSDGSWWGKVLNIKDVVEYKANSLTDLIVQFNIAVDEYEDEINKILEVVEDQKQKDDANMKKELRWEVIAVTNGFALFDYKTDTYIGSLRAISKTMWTKDHFDTIAEAQEFLEDLCENYPDLAFVEIEEDAFLSNETFEAILSDQADFLAESIVEYFMENEESFTRHDIVKGVRQMAGPDVEIGYEEWKPLIIDVIDENLSLYDYSASFESGRFLFSYDPQEEEEEVDEKSDTVTVDSAANAESDDDGLEVTPLIQSDGTIRDRVIMSAKNVREAGGSPGDTMMIYICEKFIFMNTDLDKLAHEHVAYGSPKLIKKTLLKVDKSCNIQIRKYMFDLAGIKFPVYKKFK